MKQILSTLLFILPLAATAQRHHEFGLTVGVSNYYGDLQDKVIPDQNYNPVGGISYKYFFAPRIGLRVGAAYTRLAAADSTSDISVKRQRNLSFGTGLFEFHGGLEFNFLAVDILRAKVSPYIFGGVAVFYYNPFAYNEAGNKYNLRTLSTEGQGMQQYPDRKVYKPVNVSFPFGGGLKFFIGKTLMITTEVGLRYTATDYLDDVSKSYVNLDSLRGYKGKVAADFSFRGDETGTFDGKYPDYKFQRGDSKNYDWYGFATLGVNIYFDAFGNMGHYLQARCPAIFKGRK